MHWREVREENPLAFRSAATGALLLVPAALLTFFTSWIFLDLPLELPAWLDSISGLLLVIVLFAAIGCWVAAISLLAMPTDARRAIALKKFAEERGLHFARFGFDVEPIGLYFAESAAAVPLPRRARLQQQSGSGARALFRSQNSLYLPAPKASPKLQVALAAYKGNKNDNRGPRNTFRFLKLKLSRPLPHLMIDAKRNGLMRRLLPASTRLSFEGDFDRHFTVYAPAGYERDTLELLTPDVMVCLIDYGKNWDIEIIEDQLIVASNRVAAHTDRKEVTALLHFAELIGAEIGHQAATYSDPRAVRPRIQIAAGGRRLRRRSELWVWLLVLAIGGGFFAFPFVLGWILDRT